MKKVDIFLFVTAILAVGTYTFLTLIEIHAYISFFIALSIGVIGYWYSWKIDDDETIG